MGSFSYVSGSSAPCVYEAQVWVNVGDLNAAKGQSTNESISCVVASWRFRARTFEAVFLVYYLLLLLGVRTWREWG